MIFLFIGLFILVIVFFRLRSNVNYIVSKFSNNNVIVFGPKGSGKDLVFQTVIASRKKRYLSNIPYGGDYDLVTPKDISVSPNTYNHLINGSVVEISKKHYEGVDVYFSDGGIIFPSQYDNVLSKLYPSFPIYYALSRHLYNSNVHINTQALGRIWLKIREQADHYILCRRSFKFLWWFFIKVTYYDTYSSAEGKLRPMVVPWSVPIFGPKYKELKALKEQFEATNGIIRSMWLFVPRRRVKYDTRYYHKVFFGADTPY